MSTFYLAIKMLKRFGIIITKKQSDEIAFGITN
ncbi:uncharacterized protein YqgQ [Pedobacter zeae]|uniref:Uncharacterized protein YqgQ n=1 Tax=Pedobacter zeae TaxID=1737356 RepID=A0A7W6K801_9SPHI|nr:uncharacterized protein YqgQ [Pedobacter zeae]